MQKPCPPIEGVVWFFIFENLASAQNYAQAFKLTVYPQRLMVLISGRKTISQEASNSKIHKFHHQCSWAQSNDRKSNVENQTRSSKDRILQIEK